MDESVNLQLHPAWRQAVSDFLAADIQPDTVLSNSWFEAHFGMEILNDDTTMTVEKFRERQFQWMSNFEAFKTELLEQHQIYLVNIHGEGYRLVPPSEQTCTTQEKFEREVKKSYRLAAVRLKNVRVAELTVVQRKENVDAISRLSMLRGMHRAIE